MPVISLWLLSSKCTLRCPALCVILDLVNISPWLDSVMLGFVMWGCWRNSAENIAEAVASLPGLGCFLFLNLSCNCQWCAGDQVVPTIQQFSPDSQQEASLLTLYRRPRGTYPTVSFSVCQAQLTSTLANSFLFTSLDLPAVEQLQPVAPQRTFPSSSGLHPLWQCLSLSLWVDKGQCFFKFFCSWIFSLNSGSSTCSLQCCSCVLQSSPLSF